MEKGFNDDELADIMNEIESLEKEFAQDSSEIVDSPVEQSETEPTMVKNELSTASDSELNALDGEEDDGFAEMAGLEDPADNQLEVAPVMEEEVAPVMEKEVAPVMEEEVAPVMEEEVAPVMEEEVVPVTEEEIAPVMEEEAGPIVALHEEESNEVLGELSKLPENKVIPVSESQGEVHSMESSNTKTGHETAMEFSVQGEMKLNLTFHVNGKKVELAIDENDFNIELDGGMKFSIPLDSGKEGKKAA